MTELQRIEEMACLLQGILTDQNQRIEKLEAELQEAKRRIRLLLADSLGIEKDPT